MQHRKILWLIILGTLLAACTLSTASDSSLPPTSTITTLAAATFTPPPTDARVFPTLETSTGPYPNSLALLDTVCFEFLSTLAGESWVWNSADDLNAFYNRADGSELCPGLVTRSAFDFSTQVLVGTVFRGQGCDAAYHVIDLVQDDAAQTQTLRLELALQPGCDYELVLPFLIAVPRPPQGYTLQVTVTS
jgi:hypothetical protein